MSVTEFTIRIIVAFSAGMLIGIERQVHHKYAGLRTNSLVALGSAIFVLLSYNITQTHNGDITRIIGQVVTGAGFLCAGVVLHQGNSVQGLTTAVTIWCSCAIGCLAAAGLFPQVAICTVIVILINIVFRKIDDWMEKKAEEKNNRGEDRKN